MTTLAEMQTAVVNINRINGWYTREVPFPEAIALIHSEASEALEAWREHGFDDMTDIKPEGVGSEFADIFIRLLDYCERFGIDLQEEFERKLEYNKTRAFRHGNKRA